MSIDYDAGAADTGHDDAGHLEFTQKMNITPLIDVLLVLLVMLIITIPVQQHAVNIEIPSGAPQVMAVVPPVVQIEITQDNQVLWESEPLSSRAALEAHLRTASALPEQPEIHIRPQITTKYDVVAAILTASQNAGLKKFGIVGLEAAQGDQALPSSH